MMETLLDLDSLSSARQKTPHEYATACPACGGHDRFVILPHRPPTGRYFCRQCGASGDGIDYLRTFEGMSYPDACRAFGITPKQYTRQERNAPQKRNMGHSGAYQRRPVTRKNWSHPPKHGKPAPLTLWLNVWTPWAAPARLNRSFTETTVGAVDCTPPEPWKLASAGTPAPDLRAAPLGDCHRRREQSTLTCLCCPRAS